jgi:60S ribosome subunit biogenesis protein NIP7 homolog
MRPLNAEETKLVIDKLKRFIGDNVALLTDRKDDAYNFHLNGNRVYYSSNRLTKLAGTISRKNLISFGTCVGKFTKTKKFHLTITGLDYLALYAKVNSQFYI